MKIIKDCLLWTTIALTCVGFVLLSMTAFSSCSKKNKVIGYQLYSVLDAVKADPEATVSRLTAMGYNSFELVQWGGDTTVFGLPAADFVAICDKYGAKIVSTHSSLQEDPEHEAETMDKWRSLFEIQKSCGGKYFVIPSYQVDYTVEGVQRMCDYFNKVGKLASEYGLKLGYHNHAGEYKPLADSDTLMWEYLVENTDPEYVCFELDVYWCTRGGQDPVAYLKKYPNRIELLHVKDEFVIGETGEIDFEAIFNQFYKNGMKDYFVEIETPKELWEAVNEDGSKLSPEQILEAKFDASVESANYLQNSVFVK